MKVTFITDQEAAPSDLKGEIIHFGAPRLHQIFRVTKKLAAYIRLYEEPQWENISSKYRSTPGFFLNIKVSYRCDRKHDILRSIGLNLINGMLVEKFHEKTGA